MRPGFLITARSFDEYRGMFALSDSDLARAPILDCAAGASSFGAEARSRRVDVVSVDPAYASAGLIDRAWDDHRLAIEQSLAQPGGFVWTYFASLEAYEDEREQSIARFGQEFARHARYVAAALPDLPFGDGTFGLALVSHLLSLYADELDFAFHVAAVQELVRVCRGEVRIFPLLEMSGQPFRHLDALRADLARDGIASEVREVPYEFQRHSTRMLVCTRS